VAVTVAMDRDLQYRLHRATATAMAWAAIWFLLSRLG
jgi:hypothetical protein